MRDNRSVYQDVPLHQEEEFKRLAGEQEKELPDAASDPHAYMLARLQFELEERQRFVRMSLEQAGLETPDSHWWQKVGGREERAFGGEKQVDKGQRRQEECSGRARQAVGKLHHSGCCTCFLLLTFFI